VIAEWREDNTPGIINSIILASVIGGGATIYSKTRRSKSSLKNMKRDQFDEKENPFETHSTEKDNSSFFEDQRAPFLKKSKVKDMVGWLLGR